MGVGSDNGSQPATDLPRLPGAPERRRDAVMAGYGGDPARATAMAGDDDPSVRAAALGALVRLGALDDDVWADAARRDPDASVRRRACELAGQMAAHDDGPARWTPRISVLSDALGDDDDAVTEAAAWALGEYGDKAMGATEALMAVAGGHHDALCREAAVAALGAVGTPAGLPAVLAALDDKPAVRRRAAIALAAFDDPEATEGLRRCAGDRDWQVRQAAEDLLSEELLSEDPRPEDLRPEDGEGPSDSP